MWFWITLAWGLTSSTLRLLNRYSLRGKKDTLGYTFLLQATAALVLLPIIFTVKSVSLPKAILPYLTLLASAVLGTIFLVAITKAVSYVEASVSVVVYQTKNIWTLILAVLLLNESASLTKILGVGLIFMGVVLVSLKSFKIRFDKGLLIIQLAALAATLENILDKYTLRFFSPAIYTACISSLMAIFILPMLKKYRPNLKSYLSGRGKLVFLTGLIAALSSYLAFSAISLGQVSKVIPIKESFTAATVIGGILFLKERGELWKKILGGLITVVGVILVRIG